VENTEFLAVFLKEERYRIDFAALVISMRQWYGIVEKSSLKG
jgi:hypothetical protein